MHLRHRWPLGAALALLLVLPTAAAAATRTATCEGSADRCTATFALRGTESGDRLVVRLSDTDLQLRSIAPSKRSLTASYGFGGFSTRAGGSLFRATLLRDGPVGRGATITFAFAVPPAMRACGVAWADAGDVRVRIRGVRAHGLSCAAARRAAARCVAGTGPKGRAWTIFQVDDLVSLRRGDRRVTFDARGSGATCVPVG